MPSFASSLEKTLHAALAHASERSHEYATLEHLLLAMTEDDDAVPVLQGLLEKIIVRLMKALTRLGYLVEEEGMSYLADLDPDSPLTPLQAASCTYRIALGPRAGQKVLSLRRLPGRDGKAISGLCADAHGFSLHAGVNGHREWDILSKHSVIDRFQSRRYIFRQSIKAFRFPIRRQCPCAGSTLASAYRR